MADFNVDLIFDDETDGEPIYYITEDKKLRWPYEKCMAFDWKEQAEARRATIKMSKKGNVVELFDGSDNIILALMEDAIKVKGRK